MCSLRNSTGLTTRAVANFTRSELAYALRQQPYYVNMLIAGWDTDEGEFCCVFPCSMPACLIRVFVKSAIVPTPPALRNLHAINGLLASAESALLSTGTFSQYRGTALPNPCTQDLLCTGPTTWPRSTR